VGGMSEVLFGMLGDPGRGLLSSGAFAACSALLVSISA
jgi:hypothetical protein